MDRSYGQAHRARSTGAVLAVTHLLGLVVGRYIMRVQPLADMDRDQVVALVAPALQNYLDGTPPDTAGCPRSPAHRLSKTVMQRS